MIRRILILLMLSGHPVVPSTAQGQQADTLAGVQLRFNGDVVVPAGQQDEFVLVVDGNARVEGEVRTLVVLNGTARLVGARVKDLVVARGRAELAEGSVVSGDAHLADADLQVEPGSSVAGRIDHGFSREVMHGLGVVVAMAALGLVIAIMVAGLVAAAVAAGPVRRAGAALTSSPGRTLLAAVVVWIALPVAAALLMATVIGIPTAFGVFLFVLPALGFIGFLVSGIRLGDWLIERLRGQPEPGHPYLAALAGIGLLLLAGLLPVLGGLVTTLAFIGGAGAVGLTAWQATRRPAAEPAG